MIKDLIMKSIPDKIVYVYHTSVKIEVNSNKIEVYPSYVADFDSKIDLNKARNFVKYYKNLYKNIDLNEDVFDNNLIKIKLMPYDFYRGAFDVLIDNKYLVHLNMDTLSDIITNVKINKGIVDDNFIWGKPKTRLKLIRNNSNLYNILYASHLRGCKKIINKNDLEVGGIYYSKNKRSIFLGKVSTSRYDKRLTCSKFKKINGLLFFELTSNDPINYIKNENDLKYLANSAQSYNFKFLTNHSYREKIGKISLSENLISDLRKRILYYFKNNLDNLKCQNSIEYWYYANRSRLDIINMYKYKNTPVEPFDIKKYLLFS